jgi:sirohydrochlorin cobaltochelatase
MTGKTAVLLVGHGSARHPESAAPILTLADSLRATGAWSDVQAAFMKQEPGLDGALDRLDADRVVIVPVFAGKGYYTDILIPRALGLEGPTTVRDGRTLHLTPPAGGHPRIPALMAARAETVARQAGLEPERTGLLLVAHGSSRPGGAGDTPKAIAAAIASLGRFAEVALVFLEQEPFATDWPESIRANSIVALPLLVAQGMHASQDIPPLFGLTSGQLGPVDSRRRTVLLATGLGAEPELADIIADMVAATG